MYNHAQGERIMYKHAIVCPPCSSFAQGLTSAELGAPNLALAQKQHRAYCKALELCGLALTILEPDPQFPDSTFVEDTAVLTRRSAILANPGAVTRRGEVQRIARNLDKYYPSLLTIQPPGTLDGGDICQVDDHFFIGFSERTNEDGAQQLARILVQNDYSSNFVDIRGFEGLLHLKSGIAYLGDQRLVVIKGVEDLTNFKGYETVYVDEGENYAANCVRVNDYVLVAAGYPKFSKELSRLDYQTLPLEVSEFQKMDGGLSCLSLRF
jgi:dimethylargininase